MHILLIPALIVGALSAHLALVWHQTHTQFRPKGTPEESVTGTPVWPKFALKSVGLAFMTFAVLTALGGLVQINPVWLYGPFVPYSAPSPAQPDFYAGWLEGILRLWPNWEFHLFGHTIGELFLPAVVIPGIIFTVLALWPFIEARATRDRAMHHDAQRPRDVPVRAGIGAAGIAFFVLLMLAGSNDVLAKYLQVEVDTLNGVLKMLLFVVPVLVFAITWWICRDLRARGAAPIARPTRVEFRRNAAGGFDESHGDGGGSGGARRRDAGRRGGPMRRTATSVGALIGLAVSVTSCSSSFGMPRGSTEQGEEIFDLWQIFFWAGIVVAALVYGLIAWSLIRYRRRRREPDGELGRQFHANVPLEIVYTVIPVVIVIVLFALSFGTEDRASSVSPTPDVVLRAEAFSWGWRFGYPDDGRRGRERAERRGGARTGDPASPRAHDPHRAHVERRDPRVLGGRLPVQARRDPRQGERVRRDADRDRHLPRGVLGVLRHPSRVHDVHGARGGAE